MRTIVTALPLWKRSRKQAYGGSKNVSPYIDGRRMYVVREYLNAKEFIRLLPERAGENERDEAFHKTFVQEYPRCFSGGDPALLHQLVELGMFDWKNIQLSELADTVDKLEQAQDKLEHVVQSTIKECQSIFGRRQL